MSWREERDALIAQTLEFVQSVTGKPADFAQLGAPQTETSLPPAIEVHASGAQPAALPAEHASRDKIDAKPDIVPDARKAANSEAAPGTKADLLDATAFEVIRAEAAMIDAAMRLVTNNQIPAASTGFGVRPSTVSNLDSSEADVEHQPAPGVSSSMNGHAETQQAEFTGEHFTSISTELGLQRDMQAEIKARVATFRANQERFNRERQEYFSSTLAKLRASINDTPPSDK